jgi:hypothetical protein
MSTAPQTIPPPTVSTTAAGAWLPAPPASLEELAGLPAAELAALYRQARTPVVKEMDGPLQGRMLAVPALPGFLAGVLRRFAAWRQFPWRGKTFTARAGGRGEGINRVFGDVRPRRWFPFDTFVAPSRAGAFDAVQLDYDRPSNPRLIRAIKDEVREVAPGLYLGLAYLVWRGKPRLVLYFGLRRP